MPKSKTTSKKIVKEPEIKPSDAKARKKPGYKSFKFHKRIKHHSKPIASWWVLFKKSLLLIKANKKQIAIFAVVYGLLNLILVRGFSSPVDTQGLQDSFSEIIGEDSVGFATGFTSFGLLVNASVQGSGEVAQVYQMLLLIVSSLSLIWLFRQQQAGNLVTMKMAFYRGMYPLIPFILVLLVVGLQLIPALIGNYLFSTVISGGLAVNGLEKALWFLFFASTLLLSLYMICSSTIALYIVTLPEITPMIALRQARELVRYRRSSIFRKIIALILIILAALFVIVLPIIFIAPTVAQWVFFALTVLGVPFVIGYMFSLYRELL